MRRNPRFIHPPNTLKMKVGEGGIPAFVIKRAQEYIDNNPVDYLPYAIRHLENLKDIREKIKNGHMDSYTARRNITNIVMQIKSNGSMFHYQLMSMISDVMLRFMEGIEEINSDFLDIFDVFCTVSEVILNKGLKGNGGPEGYALTQELHNACHRYQLRYTKKR